MAIEPGALDILTGAATDQGGGSSGETGAGGPPAGNFVMAPADQQTAPAVAPAGPVVSMAGSPTATAASAQAVNQPVMGPPPHNVPFVNMLQNMFIGLGAFGKSIATGGREGGEPEVIQTLKEQAEMKMQQTAQQRIAKESDLRMKTMAADYNMKQAQLASFIQDMPLRHQQLSNNIQEQNLDLLLKKGVPLMAAVDHVEGQSTDQHLASVNTAAGGDFTNNLVIPTYGANGAGGPGGKTTVVPAKTLDMPLKKEEVAPNLVGLQAMVDEGKSVLGANDAGVKVAQGQIDLLQQKLGAGGTIALRDWLAVSNNINVGINQRLQRQKDTLDLQTKQASLAHTQAETAAMQRPKSVEDAVARATQAQIAYRDNPTPDTKKALDDANTQTQALKRSQISQTYAEAATRIQAQRAADQQDINLMAAELIKPDNLTALKDVSSMRGDQRLRLYAAAKKLDPSFDPGLVNNRIRFLGQFTNPNGKTMQNIASYNTFEEHAGDLADVVNQGNQASPGGKWLNTPLNKVRNTFGDTSYTTLMAAVNPVREEYTNFLKAGFAPHEADIKAGQTIMSDNASPGQLMAALKQMTHTAIRRGDSINQQYRSVMGADYPDLITPNAREAVTKLGLGDMISKYGTAGQVGKTGSGGTGTFNPNALPDAPK